MIDKIDLIYNRIQNYRQDNPEKPLCDKFINTIDKIMLIEEKGERILQALNLIKRQMQWIQAFDIVTFHELDIWFDDHTLTRCGIFINSKDVLVKDGWASLWNSKAKVFGHSHVTAYGDSKIVAFDTSNVVAFDESDINAKDCIVTSFNDSKVRMRGYGKVEAFDKSSVVISGYSMCIQNDESIVSSNSTSFVVDRRK